MHAFLIVGKNKEAIEQKITKIIKPKKADVYEFCINKISDVRELNKILKHSISHPTVILIRNIENASVEALSAFLKNLEEPQKNVIFILTTTSENKILPTIISRCQIVNTRSSKSKLKPNDEQEYLEFINKSTGEKFGMIDKIKNREEAVKFLENLTQILHNLLILEKNNQIRYARYLKEVQKTLYAINMNGNINLQLSNFALRL